MGRIKRRGSVRVQEGREVIHRDGSVRGEVVPASSGAEEASSPRSDVPHTRRHDGDSTNKRRRNRRLIHRLPDMAPHWPVVAPERAGRVQPPAGRVQRFYVAQASKSMTSVYDDSPWFVIDYVTGKPAKGTEKMGYHSFHQAAGIASMYALKYGRYARSRF